jgi:hypothetical protein
MPMCFSRQKEDDAEQEEDMVISRHHMFGTEVDEGYQVYPGDFLDVALVAFGDAMGECGPCEDK